MCYCLAPRTLYPDMLTPLDRQDSRPDLGTKLMTAGAGCYMVAGKEQSSITVTAFQNGIAVEHPSLGVLVFRGNGAEGQGAAGDSAGVVEGEEAGTRCGAAEGAAASSPAFSAGSEARRAQSPHVRSCLLGGRGAQRLQKTLPHRRQWCLRRAIVNGAPQAGDMQRVASRSGTHGVNSAASSAAPSACSRCCDAAPSAPSAA